MNVDGNYQVRDILYVAHDVKFSSLVSYKWKTHILGVACESGIEYHALLKYNSCKAKCKECLMFTINLDKIQTMAQIHAFFLKMTCLSCIQDKQVILRRKKGVYLSHNHIAGLPGPLPSKSMLG